MDFTNPFDKVKKAEIMDNTRERRLSEKNR